MNTGIDDAANLAWKLAAIIHGWGGDPLLGTYESERHRIAIRNTSAARAVAQNVQSLSAAAAIDEQGAAAEAERHRVAAILSSFGEEFASIGVQLGARYEGSPVVRAEGAPAPPDLPDRYMPPPDPAVDSRICGYATEALCSTVLVPATPSFEPRRPPTLPT